MPPVIFYSWQSDRPSKVNRTFIERSLKNAVKFLKKEVNTFLSPRIDSDVKGTTGAIKIADEILAKIDCCSIFVADVTPLPKPANAKRITPNPNVMFELGYAANSIGWDRVILVLNSAYAKTEELPFDIRGRRTLSYCASEEETDLKSIRNSLQKDFESALRSILSKPFSSSGTLCFWNNLFSLEITVHRPVNKEKITPFEKYIVLLPIVLKGAPRSTLTNIDCYLDFPEGLTPKDEEGLKHAKRIYESQSDNEIIESVFLEKSEANNNIGDYVKEIGWLCNVPCPLSREKLEDKHTSLETATLTVNGQQVRLHIKKLKANLVQELPKLYVIINADNASFPAVIQYHISTDKRESGGKLILQESKKDQSTC